MAKNGRWSRWVVPAGVVLILAAVLVYLFWPAPVPVDLAQVMHGPLRVMVEDDGRTRVMDRYVVSAPLAGNMLRLSLDAGDEVKEGEVIARIAPRPGDPLDPRTASQAQARVQAAQANVQQAQAVVQRNAAELERAQREVVRIGPLVRTGASTQRELDDAMTVHRVTEQNLEAARFAQRMAEYELRTAEAAAQLLSPRVEANNDALFEVFSPCDGRVLRIVQESEAVVTPGTPIVEVGDPTRLEVEVDVLSNDGVRIRPGARVELDRWGGEHPLRGRVRLVEPSAFLKISALGVEEQRVNVIIDFDDPAEARGTLGDQYRVIARIVTWEEENVLQVPIGAMFRSGDRWAVFRAAEGRAELRVVEVGRMSSDAAQIVEGLQEGDRVILHPSDRISPDVRITAREEQW